MAAYALARLNHPTAGGLLVLLVGTLNLTSLGMDLHVSRLRYDALTTLYRTATPRSAWISSAWGPEFSYLWPGSTALMMGTLGNEGTQAVTSEGIQGQAHAFVLSLKENFCSADHVWTTDWTQAQASTTENWATHFKLPVTSIEGTFWRGPGDGPVIVLSQGTPVYTYSPKRQHEICEQLRALP